MSPSRKSCVLVCAAMAASLTPMSDGAYGQANPHLLRPTNHDGIYAVHITTERGACDKSYLWTIAISGGHVSSVGSTPMEASGEISQHGVVSLAFHGFNGVAHVVGTLTGARGAGTWSSPTMACAGTWRALRQS